MTQSLLTGASGLLAHQRKLDVVANNLANLNTTAYKSQRVLFSDLLYNTIQPATGPSVDGTTGGTNPKQVGFGAGVSQITNNFSQGVLTNTGEAFDFAIQGDGFFVVDGSQQQFTRDGAFSLDQNGKLVDPATGGLVQRFGTVGDEEGFQQVGDTSISVPLGASVSGSVTTQSGFIGNLPAGAYPPLAEVLVTASPLTTGGVEAVAATLLNDLDISFADYTVGDSVDIVGTRVNGSSYSVNVPVGPTATVGDLVDAVNGELNVALMSIDAQGNLVITADEAGEAFLSLNLEDAAGNTGDMSFNDSGFVVETDGHAGANLSRPFKFSTCEERRTRFRFRLRSGTPIAGMRSLHQAAMKSLWLMVWFPISPLMKMEPSKSLEEQTLVTRILN